MATKKQPEPKKPVGITLTSTQLKIAGVLGAFLIIPALLVLVILEVNLVKAVVLFMGVPQASADFIGFMSGVFFFIGLVIMSIGYACCEGWID